MDGLEGGSNVELPRSSSTRAIRDRQAPLGNTDIYRGQQANRPNTDLLYQEIFEAVEFFCNNGQRSHESTKEACLEIYLSAKQEQVRAASISSRNYANGEEWLDFLLQSERSRREKTILTLFGYIGVWKLIDKQASILQEADHSITEKAARSKIMDKTFDQYQERIGAVSQSAKAMHRTRLTAKISKGRKLGQILDRMGWGFLFHPNIWYELPALSIGRA